MSFKEIFTRYIAYNYELLNDRVPPQDKSCPHQMPNLFLKQGSE